MISLKCEASESVQFSTCYDPIHRFQRVKAKSSFFSKIKTYLRKKIHSLSCYNRVYLCAKIETIWVFDPCHKNSIFVWFLHDCSLKIEYRQLWPPFLISYMPISYTKSGWLFTSAHALREKWKHQYQVADGKLALATVRRNFLSIHAFVCKQLYKGSDEEILWKLEESIWFTLKHSFMQK